MVLWASANGSNVLTGLNADSITNVSPFVMRAAFSGSPDLSGIVKGFQITFSGCTNSIHDGTFEIAQNANNTDKTIDFYNFLIEDSSQDETSSPGTAIAKQNAALTQEPSAAAQAAGALNGQRFPAAWFNWLLQKAGRAQTIKTSVGRSTIATSTPTALGGEGYTVCPVKSASAWSDTVGVQDTPTDITGSELTPRTTAGNRVLVGACCTMDYSGTDNSANFNLAINGTTLANDALFSPSDEASPITQNWLIASATGGVESYKAKAYTSGATTGISFSGGRTYALEFASSVAAGQTTVDATAPNSTGTYQDVPSLTVNITPSNKPVLLLFQGIQGHGTTGSNYGLFYKLTDGTTDFAEFQNQYANSASFTTTNSFNTGWITPALTGSKTFKVQYKDNGGSVSAGLSRKRLIALEITGDCKRSATPAGTCTINDTESVVTDGSTPLSYSFTPGADINYMTMFTGWLEKTAGSGTVTLKIKIGSTTIFSAPCGRNVDNSYKTPFCLMIPTGLLASGDAVTVSAQALTSDGSTTFTVKNAGFFMFEAPTLTDSEGGSPSSTTIENVKNGKIEVTYRGIRTCSADDDLTLGLYKSEDGGAFSLLADSVIINPTPGTDSREVFYHHITDDIAEGTDVELELRASMATGSVIFEAGLMTSKELPSL